ncbi:hypothetical protein GCM10011507_01590 [Edaphobacter acidisoli]|uniref:Ice-binding protein C-terminal domain-containing protein n=1 Tax=Edaphobacter acidisoli TaxID=2040573 RepID=A0A916RFE6_9BACT|nr:PEP-CTERM sorting domain-containing protein [Edaphobacter acidisoli]GGA54067.1 hypothetical protein GCM10011507_01590 [Edaphobacter acidisoli]
MKFLQYSAVLAALVLVPLAAKADDVFTGTGGGNTFTFTLPASPTNGVTDPNYGYNAFYINNVAVDFNGTTRDLTVEFFEPGNDGGLNLDNNDSTNLFDSIELYGPQLFTGSASDPTFKLGTFSLYDPYTGYDSYSLTIAPSAVPEPSSLVLLGSGLLGVCGLVKRKIVKA